MNRKQQINDAIALLESAVARGELEERYAGGDWDVVSDDAIVLGESRYEYRVKPALMECWVNVYPDGYHCAHFTAETAARGASSNRLRTVHMREVE